MFELYVLAEHRLRAFDLFEMFARTCLQASYETI
jgi:hypothetical protein